MGPDEREYRDLLIEIRTKLDSLIQAGADQESRIRDLYGQLNDRPTYDDLKAQRNTAIAILTTVLLVLSGIVGLVVALV